MTQLELYNLALGYLATPPMATTGDATVPGMLCSTFYGPCRDAVLEDRIWTFATKQFQLTAESTAPLFDWAYQYLLDYTIPGEPPTTYTDILRVHRVDDGSGLYNMMWELQGRTIFANVAGPINVTAVYRVTDTALFPPNFCMALAARLAREICIPLTENRALHGDMEKLYQEKLRLAAGTDGSQGRSERTRPANSMLLYRR